jgi:hypothetical protein
MHSLMPDMHDPAWTTQFVSYHSGSSLRIAFDKLKSQQASSFSLDESSEHNPSSVHTKPSRSEQEAVSAAPLGAVHAMETTAIAPA